jgi:hypothetical protein
VATHFRCWRNQLVMKALMIALGMIMGQILPQHMTQRRFAEDDDPMQCFLFDRTNKALAAVYLYPAAKYQRPAWRASPWQNSTAHRTLMAS